MTSFDINVDHGSLLYQAKVWREQSEVLAKIAAESGGSQISDTWTFPLTDVVNAYNSACGDIGHLCGKGTLELANISDALSRSYATYTGTEQNIMNSIQTLGR